MKQIALSQGKFAIVDDTDYEWLNSLKWFAIQKGTEFYAAKRCDGCHLYMHQLIMQPDNHRLVIDHINRNPLDNRRKNLRLVTTQENLRNRRVAGISAFRYVSYQQTTERWCACVTDSAKCHVFLGYYDTEIEAHNAVVQFQENDIEGDYYV